MATQGPPATTARPDLFPKSADQKEVAKQVKAGTLWIDPDFPPKETSVYGAGAAAKAAKAKLPAVVAWLRPHEFAPLVSGEKHELISDGAAAGDVIQGALGDCYFLGALSTVAASTPGGRSRLLSAIMPLDGASHANPPEGLAQGFFTFRFYIFGAWIQVTVDTLVPCGADRRPLFARTHDVRELWVIYFEKAYAKLHRSYAAIEGGSLTAALVDLSGGYAEQIDLTSALAREELASGRLWRRLMRYQKLGYLMGCAVSVSSGETEAVTAGNLMQNHAYGILAHYEQQLSDTPGEPLQLVKLRNPWGRGEWTGRWADGTAEWKGKAGEYAADQLGYVQDDDGTFFIEFREYAAAINTIYVCKVLEAPDWHRCEISDSWSKAASTAGGCFNFETWRSNPQWQLRIGSVSHAHFVLLQPDARVFGQEGARAAAGHAIGHAIGLYLMRGHDRFLRRVLVDSEEIDGEEVVDSTDFVPSREVSCNTLDEEGELPLAPDVPYVLVPSSFLPGAEGPFKIIIYTHAPPAVLAPIPALRSVVVRGKWEGPTAGGPRGHVSWKRNPQFLVHARSEQPTRISIVLHRDDPTAADTAADAKGVRRKGIHARAGGGAEAALAKEPSRSSFNTAIGFTVAHAETEHPVLANRRALLVRRRDEVDRADYARESEVACEFLLKEAGSFVVIPSTSAPGQHGEFGLTVYSDEPIELAPVVEWTATTAQGEWKGRSAAGCRNSGAWVANPVFALTVKPAAPAGGSEGGKGMLGGMFGGGKAAPAPAPAPAAGAGATTVHAFLSQVRDETAAASSLSQARSPGRAAAAAGGDDGAAARDPEDEWGTAAAAAGGAAAARRATKQYEGLGFHVLCHDTGGDLSLADGHATSGFYTAEEVGKVFDIEAGRRYLLLPMTYRKNVEMPFTLSLYSNDQVELRRLKPAEQAAMTDELFKTHAASVLQKAWVRHQIRTKLKGQDFPAAYKLAVSWFQTPFRHSDDGFKDVNHAINALEAAFIQLTGETDAHGKYFKRMRQRLEDRGIKVADYDMCLPGPQED